MILILLALSDTLYMTKTEIQEISTVFNNDTFKIATFEMWEGEKEWNAEQGDSLITSGISLGVYDYYQLDMNGISDMIVGWYIDTSKLPINEWDVAISNTGSKDRIFKSVKVWDKQELFIGFRARTTENRTVKVTITRLRLGG